MQINKKYSTIDKDYNAMGKYIDKKYRREFLLKSKNLHKKTLKSKLNILRDILILTYLKKLKNIIGCLQPIIFKKIYDNDFIQIKLMMKIFS